MFWGTPDVSVSFCEDKYVVSNYIAEYYNTMSALSYVIVGLIFSRTRLKRLSKIILYKKNKISVLEEILLLMAARLNHINNVIKPALKNAQSKVFNFTYIYFIGWSNRRKFTCCIFQTW